MNKYYVYIVTNKSNKVLYIGVTNNLIRRIYEHRNGLLDGFTKKYKCTKLVWFEETNSIYSAIEKEKQMKKWKREYKVNLINSMNPNWIDLYEKLL
ncbi:MAG: GIY-YIG nuclease family protein [Candidatus Kapabacteria bacterium]|nr:GIY-YIG nuclease family protein [Candidatus Kapabacteria bacterium]